MASKPKVIIYSTSTCPWCERAKEFFAEHKVQYAEKDVADDEAAANEMIQKSGQMNVPVIDIDGKIIVGYDEPAFRKLLKITK